MPKDCCKDKTEIAKIKDDFIPTSIVITPSTEITTVVLSYIQTFNRIFTENNKIESNLYYLYPPDNPISLSILYRSILI